MFPDSLALTNYPKPLQQTFDVKLQPPQAITIETLHPPQACPQPNNSVSQNKPKTDFERRMFAMQLLAQKKIREMSRPDDPTRAVKQILGGSNLDPVSTKCVTEKAETCLKPRKQTETNGAKTNISEVVRLKKLLEGQLSQLESILDSTKGRKQQNLMKKPTRTLQTDDKELVTKINKILTSLLREISSLERQILRFQNGNGHNDVGQNLLSTYQFSMSFIQTYHNEYSSKISERSQDAFKEKLAKLTKSLTNCVSQLSEFPNFDFPMPDLPSKPHKPTIRNPAIPQKNKKVSNPRKVELLPKRQSKNHKTSKPLEYTIPLQNKCFARRTNYNRLPENVPTNFSSDESLISLIATKPGHSRLSSPSNSRTQLEAIPSLFLSKRQAKPVQTTSTTIYGVVDDLSQETIEELIDEQISDVLNSIDLSQIVSDNVPMPHFKPLPALIEDLDYYLSAINSYEDLLSSVEKKLNSVQEEPVFNIEPEAYRIPQEISTESTEQGMIIIPKPDQLTEDTHTYELDTELGASNEKFRQRLQPIDPVIIQNLTDDRYKMMRYNRLHQPSIRLALKHNLLERMKDEILNSTMDNVSQQIFRTLDNYVEKNFFDEFLKTPETVDLVRNILRKSEDSQPPGPIPTSTLGIQTEQRTKNVQLQSVLASPTPTNSPLSSQVYSSDFSSYSLRTDRSVSDNGVLSENSEISIRISERSIEIPSQIITTEEISHPHKGSEEVVYGVSITEHFSEISVGTPTLSHESPLPANDPASSSDSQTRVGSSIYISHAVAELRTLSEAQLSLPKSESIEASKQEASKSTRINRHDIQQSSSSSLTSQEPSLSDLAYSSVLRKRSDIVCLDIESMLPLADTTEPPLLSNSPSHSDKYSEPINEYSDTFTQSNSTLYSLSQIQVPVPPLTPIFQDSLDSSRALTHSASSRGASDPTESIEEEISDF